MTFNLGISFFGIPRELCIAGMALSSKINLQGFPGKHPKLSKTSLYCNTISFFDLKFAFVNEFMCLISSLFK